MFTARKIASYIFFAFAFVALLMNLITSSHTDGTKLYAQKATYSVVETSVADYKKPANDDEYTYSVLGSVTYTVGEDADERTYQIIEKKELAYTRVKDSATNNKVIYANEESKIDAYKNLLEKINAVATETQKSSLLSSVSGAIETAEMNIAKNKSVIKESKTNKFMARSDNFWNGEMSLIGINGYMLVFLFCSTVGAFLFLKKEEKETKAK
jgi:hypothetical protein